MNLYHTANGAILMAVMRFLLVFSVIISEIQRVSCLSVCEEVDVVFVVHSNVIIQDGNDQSLRLQKFIQNVIYRASSEKSGVGVIVYDKLPSNLDPTSSEHLKILGLSETKGASIRKTKQAIDAALDFSQFFSENVASSNNVATLDTALDLAHTLFSTESNAIEDVVFILSTTATKAACIAHYKSESHTDTDIEKLYFVEIAVNSDDEIEVDAVYDCGNEGVEDPAFVGFHKLYEITCPSNISLGESGNARLNKMDNYMDAASIISCNLEWEEIVVDTAAKFNSQPTFDSSSDARNPAQEYDTFDFNDTNSTFSFDSDAEFNETRDPEFILTAQSVIRVDDNVTDKMSFEKGYVLLTKEEDFETLNAMNCSLPVFKIIKITEISTTATSRILDLNVISANHFEYVETGHIKHHQNLMTRRRMINLKLVDIDTGLVNIDVGPFDIKLGTQVAGFKIMGVANLALNGYFQFSIEIGLDFILDIDWCFIIPCGIDEFLFDIYGGINFDFELNTTVSGRIVIVKPLYPPKPKPGAPKAKPMIPFWIGPIPFVMRPKMALALKTVISSPKMMFKHSFGLHFHPYFKIGIQYTEAKGWEKIEEYRKDYDYHNSFNFKQPDEKKEMCPSGSVTMGLEVKIGVVLYETLFVYLVLFPAIKFNIEMPSKCGFTPAQITAGALECTENTYIPKYMSITPALVISIGVGYEVECNFLMDLFSVCQFAGVYWIIKDFEIYRFPEICVDNFVTGLLPMIPISLPFCCRMEACYQTYPGCAPDCLSFGTTTKIHEIYKATANGKCYQVLAAADQSVLTNPDNYAGTDLKPFDECPDGCPTKAPTTSPTRAPTGCWNEYPACSSSCMNFQCSRYDPFECNIFGRQKTGWIYRVDGVCYKALTSCMGCINDLDNKGIQYPSALYRFLTCDEACGAIRRYSGGKQYSNVGGNYLFQQGTKWYDCPNGYILAGFDKNHCQRDYCLENMHCVSPAKPVVAHSHCYQVSMNPSFNGAGTVECRAGYFVRGIYHSDGHDQLYAWEWLRCCTYPSNRLVSASYTETHNWANCFGAGQSRHWCLVPANAFITGLQRSAGNGDLQQLIAAKTRKIYDRNSAVAPPPTPAPTNPTPPPTPRPVAPPTYPRFLNFWAHKGLLRSDDHQLQEMKPGVYVSDAFAIFIVFTIFVLLSIAVVSCCVAKGWICKKQNFNYQQIST